MGCECLKPEEVQKEIKTSNIEDKHKYIYLKAEKIKDIDTYITSLKTSDKNTFNANRNNEIFQQSKNENNKIFFSSESIKEKITTPKNNSNKETAKKTLDNIKIKNKRFKNDIKIKKNPKTFQNEKTKSKIKLKKQCKVKKEKEEFPNDDFSKYIYEHINKIRKDPQSFIPNIEEAKSYISRNKHNKLIYKKNVKVALSQGLIAFEEAISILKFCKPMNKLLFDQDLVVKLPQNEEEIENKDYFKGEIKKMIENGIPIRAYWRDIIKEPETSFLMMIVDDTGLKAGLKRKDILDPNMKYIGISSVNIGKHFVCFITFSDYKH